MACTRAVTATHQTLATPTIALLKSSSVLMPSVAYSIAWGREHHFIPPLLVGKSTCLTGTLVFGLGDDPAVPVHDGLVAAS